MPNIACTYHSGGYYYPQQNITIIGLNYSAAVFKCTLPNNSKITSVTFVFAARENISSTYTWRIAEYSSDTSYETQSFVKYIPIQTIGTQNEIIADYYEDDNVICNTSGSSQDVYFRISSNCSLDDYLALCFQGFDSAYTHVTYEAIADNNHYIYPQGMASSIKVYYNNCALYVENPDASGAGAGSGGTSGTGGFYWSDN